MNSKRIESQLRAANPVSSHALEALDLAAGEAALGEALVGESTVAAERGVSASAPRQRRSVLLVLGGAVAAAVVAVVVLLSGGAGRSPEPAYGAQLVRFAESSPLLLLEGGSWGIRSIDQLTSDQGWMEFTKPSPDPHPDEPLMTRSDVKRGITPVSVQRRRQRRVELNWHDGRQYKLVWHDGKLGTSFSDTYLHKRVQVYEPGRSFKTTIAALGVTAYVDPRAEAGPIQGGPGDRVMVAIWEEDGRLLELRASVPDLPAFRERLGRLRRVGAEEWLDAMPASVVKAADYAATVHQMLTGIPLPPGFDPASIPDLGVTTERYQVGAAVGGTVACAWFHSWGQARAAGDKAAAARAERVLLGSEEQWPIFREMAKEGAYPATVIEYARKMHSGVWYGRPLLQAVFGKDGLCGQEGAAGEG
jgi:hypothetical protein